MLCLLPEDALIYDLNTFLGQLRLFAIPEPQNTQPNWLKLFKRFMGNGGKEGLQLLQLRL